MKKTVYCFLCSLNISFALASIKSSATSDQKINIEVNCNPVINNPINNTQANTQTQTSTQAQTTSVSQTISQTISHYCSAVWTMLSPAALQKELANAQGQSKTFLQHYKIPLLAGTVIGSYTWLCAETIRGAQYLSKANLWSSWKRATPLTTLHEMPQEALTRELLIEIQKRYTPPDKPTEFMLPLIHFLHDVDIELQTLKHYDKMNIWLTKTRALYIVPFDLQRFSSTRERMARLALVKNLFLSWAAEYKLEHNKSSLLTQLKSMRPDVMEEI